MIKTIVLSMCLAISALSLNARAQDVRGGIATARSLRWTTFKLSTGILKNTSNG